MGYSTEAEFRANVSIGTVANISQANVLLRIIQADYELETDLAKVVDFTAIVVTPTFLNLLSQYKVAELSLVYMYGRKRKGTDVTDTDYWIDKYNKKKDAILSNKVSLVDGSTPAVGISKGQQTFVNTAKEGIEPALGVGTWGDFKSKADLLADRPVE